MRILTVVLTLCLAFASVSGACAQEDGAGAKPQRLRTYYFGNSLTGGSDPKWHKELGASVGKEWEAWAFLGAGWQLWQHRHALQNGGVEMKRDDKGALTIDPESIKHSTGWNVKQFYQMKWDAIVLQPFSMGLSFKAEKMWRVDFGQETDVGDVAAGKDLIDIFLSINPKGKVYVYQDWPSMRPGKLPSAAELPEWAVEMKKRAGKIGTAEFPDREGFDYEQKWLRDKYSPTTDLKRHWLQKNARSKDYHRKVFAALKEKSPKLWEEGRLRVIPVGDVFMALHRKMVAGESPGCTDIKDYYTDVQHIRGGLPRYTVAASFYAVMFGEHPGKLDWKLYNSLERYQAGRKGPDDPHHDRGEIFEITPERAKIVNDTIWQIVTTHPFTRMAQTGQ